MDPGNGPLRPANPRDKANIISVFLFGYIFPTLWWGSRRDVNEKDIYDVAEDLNSKKITDKLEKQWELMKFNYGKVSLMKLLIKCYGWRLFMFGVIQLPMEIIFSILNPLTISKLVQYFVPGQTEVSSEEVYFYSAFNIGLMIISTLYYTHLTLAMNLLALEVRMAFSSLMYRKVLKLHPTVLSEMTTGKVVILITKDLHTIDSVVHCANDFWKDLVVGAFNVYLIYQKVGVTALVALVLIAIVFPVQGILGSTVYKKRKIANQKSDERVQLTQEILSVIRIIKMYTWEKVFSDRVIDAREKEIKSIRSVLFCKYGAMFTGDLLGKLGFNIILIIHLLRGYTLDAQIIYYVSSSYHRIRHILTYLVSVSLTNVAEFLAAFKRIDSLLNAEELQPTRQFKQSFMMTRVLMRNAYLKLGKEEILKDITFNFESGLNVIMGPVGSGKSTLIKALLHEYKVSSGNVFINGKVSYASQQPWLFPSTIRQNIVFGSKYDEERYRKVLEVCALNLDLNLFPNGDHTIITESGANLSKGQQTRVNLARAVYRESDIYILDDCFSALDVNVQNFIFNSCIQRFLKNKLIILVTHNPSFLDKANYIMILKDGQVEYSGKPNEDNIMNYVNKQNIPEVVEDKIEAEINYQISEVNGKSEVDKEKTETARSKNIYSEDKKGGSIGSQMYKRYIAYGGYVLFIFLLLMHISVQVLFAASEKLVSIWVNKQNASNVEMDLPEKEEYSKETISAIFFLSSFAAAVAIAKFLRAVTELAFSIKISRNIHTAMAKSVLYAKVQFFDRNLIGNILNRFSRDLGYVDEYLSHAFYEVIKMVFVIGSTVALIISVNFIFISYAMVLFILSVFVGLGFTPTARGLMRLEASSRSPMIGHLNSTVEGITSVRAFKKQEILKVEFDEHQNYHISTQHMGFASWMIFFLICNTLCAIFIAFVLATFLAFKSDYQAGDVGLSLGAAVSLGIQLQSAITHLINLESNMTCVERVLEYIDEPQEDENGKTIENWPNSGAIDFEKVSLSYPLNSKPVLKNLNIEIQSGEKIGIVGRTGAGKSSILVALYRFYDVTGEILIDKNNISDVSLEALRLGISIIPQEPVIFTGTIRSNIDPKNKYSDQEIWNALEIVNLKEMINNLNLAVDPKTSGFSVGEKQLISVARAVIRKNKIVVLDEATANMDKETEKEINTKIKQIFKDCTLLIIAHRIETILDCDKVIVMDQGEIAEYDNPLELAAKEDSKFHDIMKKTGTLKTCLERRASIANIKA